MQWLFSMKLIKEHKSYGAGDFLNELLQFDVVSVLPVSWLGCVWGERLQVQVQGCGSISSVSACQAATMR